MTDDFDTFLRDLKKRFAGGLWLTSMFAAGVSVAAVTLLGVSGWFLTGAAIAGAAGPLIAQGFNYLLPSALIRTLAIGRTVLRYGERYVGHSVALRAMARLRPALFARILAAPPGESLKLSGGETASRFVADVAVLENALVLQSAPPAAIAGMTTAVVLAAIGDPWAAVVLFIGMGLSLATALYIHRRLPMAGGENEALADARRRFQELMAVLPDIRTSDPRHNFVAELAALEDRLLEAKTATVSREAVSAAATTVMTGLSLVVMAMVSVKGDLATLALGLLAGSMGFESLAILIKAISQRDVTQTAHARVAELYDRSPAPPLPVPGPAPDFTWQGEHYPLDGTLRLGLGGTSGSGKTAMAEALAGLREPESLDGDRGFGLFAFSPQNAAVLTGTIRHNLLMGGLAVADDVLWQTLDDAGLAERLQALPKGLDTWIGDGGLALSGGERKRLSLARAYLRDAPVLLLDEPTEGLDPATEAHVVDRLEDRLARTGQGLILISHRSAPHRLVNRWARLSS